MLLITNLIFLSLGDVVDFMIGRSHVFAKGAVNLQFIPFLSSQMSATYCSNLRQCIATELHFIRCNNAWAKGICKRLLSICRSFTHFRCKWMLSTCSYLQQCISKLLISFCSYLQPCTGCCQRAVIRSRVLINSC